MSKWLLTGGGIGLVILAVSCAILKLKNKNLKAERVNLKSQLRNVIDLLNKEKAVIKTHDEVIQESVGIQQQSKANKEALDAEVKEAQTSETPIQSNLEVGNDLVNRFNNSSDR